MELCINNKNKKQNKQKQKQQKNRTSPQTMFDRELSRVKSRTSIPVKPSSYLSECAAKYAIAVAAPWDPRAIGVCVPKWPAIPSQKLRLFTRFTVTTNSNGFAFVYYTPTIASNGNAGWYSSAAFGGTQGFFTTTATGVTSTAGVFPIAMDNAPYTVANLTGVRGGTQNTVRGRVVSSAISVQYTGTVFNEGGLYYLRTDPAHQNMYNISLTQFGTYGDAKILPITRRKEWLVDGPANENETEYATNPYAQGSSSADTLSQVSPWCNAEVLSPADTTGGFANPGATNVIYITSSPNNSFQVEIVTHVEYVGQIATTMLTPSHADTLGFQAVAVAQKQATATNATGVADVMKYAGEFLATQSSTPGLITAGIALNGMGRIMESGILERDGKVGLRGSAPIKDPYMYVGR